MRKTYAIFQKELKHFFYSPIAYIVIAAFVIPIHWNESPDPINPTITESE